MKIYTGGGDRGKTSLFSGERIGKEDARLHAYGEVDELNSGLGLLASYLQENMRSGSKLALEIETIQSDLFHVGARLATSADSQAVEALEPVAETKARFLERAIDRMQAELPPLKGFILPGGDRTGAWAQVVRTVCRRAERSVVRSAAVADPPEKAALQGILIYLNRLSDYLFALARYCNQELGVADRLWKR